MKHFGDITKISGYEVPIVDIITGGSPCQDLSIAGQRSGLSGERSGLFMEQLRIVKEMRKKEIENGKTADTIRPRYMVWENVPGAFSSNKGKDFQTVLTEIVKIVCPGCPDVPLPDKWAKSGCLMGIGENGQPFSVAYRLHDAQFWGVPQRRKRIALVADFNGITAPEILFEREGLSRDSSESEGEKQGIATDVERSIGTAISFQERGGRPGGGKGILIQNEHIGAMKTNQNQYVCSETHAPLCAADGEKGVHPQMMKNPEENFVLCQSGAKVIGFNRGCGSGLSMAEEKQPTIQAAAGESGNNQPLVCHSVYTTQACGDRDNPSQSFIEEKAYTLPSNPMSDRGQAVCQPILLESNQNHATIQTDGVSTTLPASMGMGGGYVPMVCKEESYCIGNGQVHDALCPSKEVSKTLNCMEDPMKIVTYALDRAMFNQGKNAAYKPSIEKEVSQTLVSRGPGAVCARDYKGIGNEYVSEDKCIVEPYQKAVGSLCARDYKGSVVRRLTPLECERLQGFPDNWTDIGDWIDSKGKKHKGESDAPRYKALGNSIALPFWQYLAEKMCKYIENPEMASLFSGIGGFELVYSRCGCKPVWASEIEEFGIAVTKMRFGEE